MRILIAEDEKNMQDIIVEYMKRGGHSCITADDGIDAVTILKNNPVDLAILDIMMPHLDGFSVCKIAREMYNFPIIFLTAKEGEDDKLKGYDYGADDYMTKPFEPIELVARVRAITRRQGEVVIDKAHFGDLTLDLSTHELSTETSSVHLSQKEFEVMQILMSSNGRVVSKQDLLTRVWGTEGEALENSVEAYISFLRKKLTHLQSSVQITTLRMLGYRLEKSEKE